MFYYRSDYCLVFHISRGNTQSVHNCCCCLLSDFQTLTSRNIWKNEEEAEGKNKRRKKGGKKERMKVEVAKETIYLLQRNIKFYCFEDSQVVPVRPW
jgi:hypothetical protein